MTRCFEERSELEPSPARLLVIDSDSATRRSHRGHLVLDGFETAWFEREADAREALANGDVLPPDLVVVDPFSPGVGGLAVCRRLRECTSAPIVVLSWSGLEQDVVTALQSGADEYLVKPISNSELSARLQALLRRSEPYAQHEASGILRFGDVELSLLQHEVRRNGVKVDLSPTEFRLLTCLVQEPDRVISHRTLMTRVWGAEYVESRHYLRLYIRYLREKLEADPSHPTLILSEWGMGYRFQSPSLAA